MTARGRGARWGARAPGSAALGLAALLGGCAELPTPQPAAGVAAPLPVVTAEQATRIIDATVDTVTAADAAGDAQLLAARVTGPALALRRTRYALVRAGVEPVQTRGADELEPLSAYVPRLQGWPRWMIVVTQPGADRSPSLALLRSESARQPYRLWASPSLLPGASLPTARVPAEGVEVVDPDDGTGLPAAPADIAARYADVLLRGADSPHATQFAEDAYRSQVAAISERDGEAVRAVGGTYEETRTLLPGSVVALRTDDGGALVMAGYDWVVRHSVPPEAQTGQLAPVLAALAGRAEVRSAVRTSAEVIAFLVPSAGGGPVRVVAAQSGPVAVDVP